jgi:hypothetical protein
MKYPILFINRDGNCHMGDWYLLAVPIQGTNLCQLYKSWLKKGLRKFSGWKQEHMGFLMEKHLAELSAISNEDYDRIDKLTALVLFGMRTD